MHKYISLEWFFLMLYFYICTTYSDASGDDGGNFYLMPLLYIFLEYKFMKELFSEINKKSTSQQAQSKQNF